MRRTRRNPRISIEYTTGKKRTLDILPRNERLDESFTWQIQPGITAIGQITKAGNISFVTIGEVREVLYLRNAANKGCYFYRSFSGTGGKQQGVWYPCGGLCADSSGNGFWIIKGSPRNEPGFGRTELTQFFMDVNNVLPHADAEVDKMFFKLTGDSSPGWASKPTIELRPIITVVEGFSHSAELRGDLLDLWKQKVLNPTWGLRDIPRPQN